MCEFIQVMKYVHLADVVDKNDKNMLKINLQYTNSFVILVDIK